MKITLPVQTATSRDKHDYAGPVVTIGRDPDATLSLDGVGVSWQHARIDLAPKKAAVSDLNSTNGTYLNRERVQGSAALKVGDTLQLGQEGPRLLVMALELAAGPTMPQPAPAAATRPEGLVPRGGGGGLLDIPTRDDDEIPLAPPPGARGKNGKTGPAPAPVSATRKLLLKEIQRQQVVQTKQKRSHWTTTAVLLALLGILTAGGAYAYWRLHGRIDKIDASVSAIGERVDRQKEEVAEQNAQHLALINAKLDAKFMEVVTKMAEQEKAQLQAQNKLTDVTKQLFNLEELNKRVKERPADPALPPLPEPPAPQGQPRGVPRVNDPAILKAPPPADNAKSDLPQEVPDARPAVKPPAPAEAAQIEFKPGDRIDLLHKNGHAYSGNLVFVSAERVKLLSNPNWPNRPSDYDMRDVLAIQTKDGMYAFSRELGAFVNALSSYALKPGSDTFVKLSGNPDTYLAENVKIVGTKTVNGLYSYGQEGQHVITLPLPNGPDSIPAYQFQTLVTSKGIFEWNKDTSRYDFTTHPAIAAKIKAENDKYWKEFQEERYRKNMEGYEAATRRLQALAPFWGTRWWWY